MFTKKEIYFIQMLVEKQLMESHSKTLVNDSLSLRTKEEDLMMIQECKVVIDAIKRYKSMNFK